MFEDNYGGLDNAKAFLHAKSWDIYVNEKEKLVKGGYLVGFIGLYKKKLLWEVFDDHVVEDRTGYEYIRLRGLDFNVSNQDEEEILREGSS